MHSFQFPSQKVRRLSLVLVVALLLVAFWLPNAAQAAPAASGGNYIVQRGETLSSIARYFGLTVYALAQANGIGNANQIYVGQHLWIPASSGGGYGCSTYHYVQRHDTLSGIAAWFGVNTWALASANGLADVNIVPLGMKLCIPSVYGPPVPPSNGGGDGSYIVKVGDTLSKIAVWNGTTVHHLMSVNGLHDPNYIYVGQCLRLW